MEDLLSERDSEMHHTIISGEIGDTTDLTDNSYHLFTVSGVLDTVLLDGLIIEKAYALGASDTRGAGFMIDSTNSGLVRVVNCNIQSNKASQGAAFFTMADVELLNCTLNNNEATEGGHSIFNNGASIVLNNVDIYQACNNCGAELVNVNGGNIDHKGAVNIHKN